MAVAWLFGATAWAQAAATSPAATAPAATAPAATSPAGFEPPAGVVLHSPHATLETFLTAMNYLDHRVGDGTEHERRWSQVMTTMGIQGPGTPEQRRTARAIKTVVDTLGELDLSTVPDVGWVEANEDRVWTLFPRPEHLWVWQELKPLGKAPAAERVQLYETDGGHWVFTPATLTGAERLAASMADLPPKYFLDRIGGGGDAASEFETIIGPTFAVTPMWGWFTLFAGIAGGVVIGRVARSILRAVGRRLHRSKRRLTAMLVELGTGPVNLVCITLGLVVGMHFVYLEGTLTHVAWRAYVLLGLIALGWYLYNLVDIVEYGIKLLAGNRRAIDEMVLPVIRQVLRIFLVVVFSLVIAQNVFGINVTGWIAGLGIIGLGVSLAAQDSLKNLFGSVTVFFDKPFSVGDFVSYGGYQGTVEKIGFRSTRIRMLSGALVTVPNMKWIDNDVENIAARPYIRREMDITICYDTPAEKIEQAVEIVRDVLTSDPVRESGRFDMEAFPPRVSFSALNADSLNIKVYYWYQLCGDPDRGWFTYLDHCGVVNGMLFRRFAEAGIGFAFPTQTLHLANDDDRQLAVRVLGEPAGNGNGRGAGRDA